MGLAALDQDYLFVGPLIQARLLEQIPGLPVEGIEQLAQAGAEDQRQRVAFVMWDGDRFDVGPNGQSMRGAAQIVVQRWLVLLYVRHASQVDRDARAGAAGPLMSQVHRAVAGWTPEGSPRPMTRAQGRAPSYTKLSGMFPLSFEVSLSL